MGDIGKYLGMPSTIRKKVVPVGDLADRISGSIRSWSSQLLSQAGKAILIKAAA